MINPQELREIEFVFKCRVGTYEREELARLHTFFSDSLKQRIKDLVGQHGVVSWAESRMEQL